MIIRDEIRFALWRRFITIQHNKVKDARKYMHNTMKKGENELSPA